MIKSANSEFLSRDAAFTYLVRRARQHEFPATGNNELILGERVKAMNRYFLFLILFLWLGMPISSTASTPDFWTKSGFTYEGNKTPIKNVLEEFSHSFGVELVYSDSVSGILDGWQKGDSGTDFLNALGVKYKFQWFVFRNKLYVSPNSDSVVKRIRVDQKAAVNMEEALKGVELFEKKFGWGQLADEGVVYSDVVTTHGVIG